MANKPRYWLAWQSISVISDLMFKSNMVYRFMAYNCYEYIFYDYSLVQVGVLGALQPQDQLVVYNDAQYGMNAIQKLIYWVGAWVEGEGSTPYNVLVNHFATLGITLTPAIMDNIVGSDSLIGYICTNIYVTLLNNQNYGEKGLTLNNFALTQVQWGNCDILGNIQNTVATIPPVQSIGDFSLDTVFTTQPEFGVYV